MVKMHKTNLSPSKALAENILTAIILTTYIRWNRLNPKENAKNTPLLNGMQILFYIYTVHEKVFTTHTRYARELNELTRFPSCLVLCMKIVG